MAALGCFWNVLGFSGFVHTVLHSVLVKVYFNLKIEGGKVERWFVERDGLMLGFRERKRNGKKAV